MKHMLSMAGNNESKKKKIKQNQIIGIEKRTDMFTFACSNMMMSGDGKSHIYQGDSFSNDLRNTVSKLKPTVGFLNPPYDVGEDGQLEFVENALSYLEKGGRCAAIVQMSCVTSLKPPAIVVRERLLKSNTLKAVFSMPDELFNPVGVVTCIMVFESGKPHPKAFKPFFGYFKNDGFLKTKNLGRIDKGDWQNIKNKWLDNFFNLKNEVGFSVTHEVSPTDEWCAEAFIETDYTALNDSSFVNTIHKFSTYIFDNKLKSLVSSKSDNNVDVKIDINQWKKFKLNDFFKMSAGKFHNTNTFSNGTIPLISASELNNGVKSFTNLNPKYDVDALTIGKIGARTFYQPKNFCVSSDVTVLVPREDFGFDSYVGMFLATVINEESFKWNYGRQIRLGDSKKLQVKLPVDKSGLPDWDFMREYVKSLPYSSNLA